MRRCSPPSQDTVYPPFLERGERDGEREGISHVHELPSVEHTSSTQRSSQAIRILQVPALGGERQLSSEARGPPQGLLGALDKSG